MKSLGVSSEALYGVEVSAPGALILAPAFFYTIPGAIAISPAIGGAIGGAGGGAIGGAGGGAGGAIGITGLTI